MKDWNENDLRYIIEYSVHSRINLSIRNIVCAAVRKATDFPVERYVGKSLNNIVWDTARGSIWISVNSYMREKSE